MVRASLGGFITLTDNDVDDIVAYLKLLTGWLQHRLELRPNRWAGPLSCPHACHPEVSTGAARGKGNQGPSQVRREQVGMMMRPRPEFPCA